MPQYLEPEIKPERQRDPDGEYLYCSARIRAIAAETDGELLSRVLDAKTANDAVYLLHNTELGEGVTEFSDYEAIFTTMLEQAYADVLGMIPDEAAVAWLRYKYDCNNIKTAIKAELRGIDCVEMLSAVGTIPPDAVAEAVAEKNFSRLPANMAQAAAESCELYAKTGDPQQIDFLLDAACARDMTAAAGKDSFSAEYVRMRIDVTNLLICLRLIRMHNEELGAGLLSRSLLPGGALSASRLAELYEGGEGKFWEAVSFSPYAAIAAALPGGNATLAEVERAADNFLMVSVRTTDYLPFGAAVLAAYLLRSETAIKNLRIAIAGKLAELPTEVIRERMRAV